MLQGPGRIAHRTDLPDPMLEHPRDAVVRVTLAGLCGSDLHPYEGREHARPGVVAGHEVVGVVEVVGPEVGTPAVGDRVLVPFTTSCGSCPACRRGLTARCAVGQLFGYGDPDGSRPALHGGQADLVRVPLADTTAVRVPDGIDDASALLLTDNLPTAWEAVERAGPAVGEPLVVVGLGAVGLCAVTAALALGAAPVVGIDPVERRRAAAELLGARTATPEQASELCRDLVGGSGAASVVEAAGSDAGQRLAFELAAPGGVLSVIAVQTAPGFTFSPGEAYDRNLTVCVGRASVRATLDRLLPRVVSGEVSVPVAPVFSHLGVPLEHGPTTYARFAAREDGLIKAAFAPSATG